MNLIQKKLLSKKKNSTIHHFKDKFENPSTILKVKTFGTQELNQCRWRTSPRLLLQDCVAQYLQNVENSIFWFSSGDDRRWRRSFSWPRWPEKRGLYYCWKPQPSIYTQFWESLENKNRLTTITSDRMYIFKNWTGSNFIHKCIKTENLNEIDWTISDKLSAQNR